jgi:hypothetical protein
MNEERGFSNRTAVLIFLGALGCIALAVGWIAMRKIAPALPDLVD